MPSTTEPRLDYVELRCHSAFSFLRGTSQPEALVAQAAALGHKALAITDRAGLYAVPRFFKAAAAAGIAPIVGAEVTVAGHPQLFLCERPVGYRNLCRLITAEKLGKQEDGVPLAALQAHAEGLIALCGGSDDLVGAALSRGDFAAARRGLDRLAAIFSRDRLYLELQIHFDEEEDRRNIAILELARKLALPLCATNDVHCAAADEALLADALACIRLGVPLDEAGTRLAKNGERYLKSAAEMTALFGDLPSAIENTAAIAARCRLTTRDLGYRFPDFPLPPGCSQDEYLRELTLRGAAARFFTLDERTRTQLQRELSLISRLGLSGYFLVVWDIIEFCRQSGILCQGRGSAANSAVCYALGITACDPLKMNLLFERFLSEERGEWPDIDLDLPSGAAREAVIQHLYKKYGPHGCAMTGSVITYRERSAARDLCKVLGLPLQTAEQLAGALSRREFGETRDASGGGAALTKEPPDLDAALQAAGLDPKDELTQRFATLWRAMQDLPRHFAQHPGGMVVAAGRLDEVVPLEPAAMPGRVVMQWDKDDCADLGLIKIDLLGLGMLTALSEARRLVPMHEGKPFELHALPEGDESVYRMIESGDTVGVFQIESRAQMAILPRTRPRTFYDLVVQVGLVRPGPIVGDMVHPYLRRRAGREPVRYPHPSLQPILERTLGVPLFQEQIMRVAMVAAGFTGGQADELRRAMDSKRSQEKMQRLLLQLRQGMEKNGISGAAADEIIQAIAAFAAYGFPESHAISFAYLTYASAYLKAHHPSVFYASLLNAWPMGFYHPSTLVKDAQRHGVRVRAIDVNASSWECTLEASETAGAHRAVRLGLRYVRGLSRAAAEELLQARGERPFCDIGDVRRRCPTLSAADMQTLAAIGAFSTLQGAPSRRDALWQVSAMPERRGLLAGVAVTDDEAPLSDMTLAERIAADYRGTSLTVGPHPLALCRKELAAAGVLSSRDLARLPAGRRASLSGLCIVRQRPPTARGFCFLTLEDEHGFINVIVPPDVFTAHRAVLDASPSLIVEGVVQRQDGALSVKADLVRAL
jgi:error-prone DNA polymerase